MPVLIALAWVWTAAHTVPGVIVGAAVATAGSQIAALPGAGAAGAVAVVGSNMEGVEAPDDAP